jgi:YVTN family beta-propeller protein
MSTTPNVSNQPYSDAFNKSSRAESKASATVSGVARAAPTRMTAYVANIGDNSVTPIAVATGIPVAPIPVGHQPAGIAITPNGQLPMSPLAITP